MVTHTLPNVKFFFLSKEVIPLYLPYTPWGSKRRPVGLVRCPIRQEPRREVKVDLLSEPEKRTARFTLQGREAGAEPRAGCEASEHGEQPPLVAGFVMVLGLHESKDASPICASAFGES